MFRQSLLFLNFDLGANKIESLFLFGDHGLKVRLRCGLGRTYFERPSLTVTNVQ
jgi:hypothetical protein